MTQIIKKIQVFDNNINIWKNYILRPKDQNVLFQNSKSLKQVLSILPQNQEDTDSFYIYDYENKKIKTGKKETNFLRSSFPIKTNSFINSLDPTITISNGYFSGEEGVGISSNNDYLSFSIQDENSDYYPCYAEKINFFNHFIMYRGRCKILHDIPALTTIKKSSSDGFPIPFLKSIDLNGNEVNALGSAARTYYSNSFWPYGVPICTNLELPVINKNDFCNSTAERIILKSPCQYPLIGATGQAKTIDLNYYCVTKGYMITVNDGNKQENIHPVQNTNSFIPLVLSFGYSRNDLALADDLPRMNLYFNGTIPAPPSGQSRYVSFCFYYPCTPYRDFIQYD